MKSATKKQQAIYALLVAVAVLAGITLLNLLSSQNLQKEAEMKAQQDAADKQAAMQTEAIKNLTATEQYQKYCVNGVQRIDTAGDYSKIVYGTAQKTVTYVDKDGKRIYCTAGVAKPSADCAEIAALTFDTAYVCGGTNVASMISGNNGLQVKTQTTGNAVIIDTVLLGAPGYVAIHTMTGSKPGPILANSQLLQAGTYKIVSIAMPSALTTWNNYAAMLHTDNGNGSFDAKDDSPITDEKGNPIMVTFKAVKGE